MTKQTLNTTAVTYSPPVKGGEGGGEPSQGGASLRLLLSIAALLLLGWFIISQYDRLTWWAGPVFLLGFIVGLVALSAWLMHWLLYLIFGAAANFEQVKQARSQTAEMSLQRLKLAAEVAEAEARAAKARRDSEVFVITAPFDHQVHISDMNHDALWRAANHDARLYANGHYTAPTPEELRTRQMFLASVGKNGKVIEGLAAPAVPAALPAGEPVALPDYVDLFELLQGPPSLHKLVFGVALDETTGQRRVVTADLLGLTHIAIAGSSGWGKSSLMRSLVYQIMLAAEKPGLLLIDLENNSLAPFTGSASLLRPLAATEDDARRVFSLLYHEMYRRLKIFEQLHVDDLSAYQQVPGAPAMPVIVCAVDEFNDLMEIDDLRPVIQRVARHCRKTGIRLIFAAQEWTMKYIDNLTQRQLSTRFQFYATDPTQARQLVGPGGKRVTQNPKKGRAVLSLPGLEFTLLQSPYLHREAIMQANPNAPRPPADVQAVQFQASVFETGPGQQLALPAVELAETADPLTDREQAILTAWDNGITDEKALCEMGYGQVGGKQYGLVRGILQKHGRLQPEPAT